MAKIKIKEEERNSYISNKSFLEHVVTYAIKAEDNNTLELLNSKCPDFNSFIKIKPEDLFKELMHLVTNDKHKKIVKLIINKFDISLSQQRDATLLNEAAYYGAAEIVRVLLAKGFDPNNRNFYGHTPLHHAVIVNSLETVHLLIKHPRIDLNIQDQDGNTPLHLATIHNDYLIITTLKNAGAEQNVANKRGYNCFELYKALIKGRAKVTMPNLQPDDEKENAKFYEGMTSFYKGILSDGNQVEYFARAINSIKTFLNELPISYDTRDFARESLWALAKLYEYYKYKDCKDSNKLQKYIIDKAEAWELATVLAVLYNTICIEYLVVANYSKACEYAKLAYDSCTASEAEVQNMISKEMQHVLLFNLGLAWKHLDVTKSLQYFAQAEEVKPNDQETTIEQLKHYISLIDTKNALDKISAIIDTDFKDFYKIILQLKSQDSPSTILQSLVKYESNSKDQGLKDLYKIMLQLESEPHSSLAELLKNRDFAHLQNNDLKNEKIIEIDETSYVPSLPKEPECSAIAMGLSKEYIEVLGASANDELGV